MNPYEYESTLDCRDDNRGGGGVAGGGSGPGTLPMTRSHPQHHLQQQQQQQQHNTLQHQNQQNLQLQQQQQSHYDYEYQHLPHRPPDVNGSGGGGGNGSSSSNISSSTAQRTHGRTGFLLDGVTPTAPPDVPPRNPTMNRMNNGRLIAGGNNPNDLGVDFEPSCLVRTPSGNVYIPSGNLNINKGSPIDYKSGSACSTPTKDTLKGYERSTNSCMGPVLPPRSVMSGIPTHHYSAPMNFRKDLTARCSFKCMAIVSGTILGMLCVLLGILAVSGVLHLSRPAPCTVLVGNEAAEVTAAKSTNTDLSKLHDPSLRSKTGQGLSTAVTASTASSSLAAAAGLQSTSASSVASSATSASVASSASQASSSSSSSSSSSLTPSSSLSSSLANANNGGSERRVTGNNNNNNSSNNNNNTDMHTKEWYKHLTTTETKQQQKRYRRSLMTLNVNNRSVGSETTIDSEDYDYEDDNQQVTSTKAMPSPKTTTTTTGATAKTFIDLITNESKATAAVNDEKYFALTITSMTTTATTPTPTATSAATTTTTTATEDILKFITLAPTTTTTTTAHDNNIESVKQQKAKSNYGNRQQGRLGDTINAKAKAKAGTEVEAEAEYDKTFKIIENVLNLNQSNQHKKPKDGKVETTAADFTSAKDTLQDGGIYTDYAEVDDDADDEAKLKIVSTKDYVDIDEVHAAELPLTELQFDKSLNNNLRRIKIKQKSAKSKAIKSGKTLKVRLQKSKMLQEAMMDDDKVKSIIETEAEQIRTTTATEAAPEKLNKVVATGIDTDSVDVAVDVIDDNNQNDSSTNTKTNTSIMPKRVTIEADVKEKEKEKEKKTGNTADERDDSNADDNDVVEINTNSNSYTNTNTISTTQKNFDNIIENDFQIKQQHNDVKIEQQQSTQLEAKDSVPQIDDVGYDVPATAPAPVTAAVATATAATPVTDVDVDVDADVDAGVNDMKKIDDNNNERDLADNYDDINSAATQTLTTTPETPTAMKNVKIVEITAGASVTDNIIENVIKVDKVKSNDRHKLSAAENEKLMTTITASTMKPKINSQNNIENPRTTDARGSLVETHATTEPSLAELMLNDGLIPVNATGDLTDLTNLTDVDDDDEDDIDIVKLEETQKKHKLATKGQQEIYKTIEKEQQEDQPKKLPPSKSENEILKPSEEMETAQNNDIPMPLKPYVSEIYDKPSKRILLNLTIDTDDGTGSIYTLHVAVPVGGGGVGGGGHGDGATANGSHNLEQVLTHEIRQQPLATATAAKEPISSSGNNFINSNSPYCVPEPPPRMPDCPPCPCICAEFGTSFDDANRDFDNIPATTTTSMPTTMTTPFAGHIETATILHHKSLAATNDNDNDGNDVEFVDDNIAKVVPFNNNDADDDVWLTNKPNESLTYAKITTNNNNIDNDIDDHNYSVSGYNDSDVDIVNNNFVVVAAATSSTNLPSSSTIPSVATSVPTSTSTTTTTQTFSTAIPGDMFACPDVMPILILEGARTFPARSFPPDGTTFGQITLGQKLTKEIQPYSYWNMQFYQSEPAYVKFDYTIPRGASIGVYGRRNALPTHTQYHFKEVLSGFSASTRTARAAHLSITREVTRYMEPGHWFVSLYNDDGDVQEVTFYAAIAEDMTQNCPNGCSGNGQCLLGHCQCNPGFGGDDCSESVCPVLCSQHGEYINGECICNPGWKGKECSLRHDECEVADCNGHGHCVSGKCQCMRGYKGKFCEEVDCPHPNCSGHGFCADGTCICKKGWKGPDCATMDQDALQCLPDCSGHGSFDLDTQTCTCESKWSGEDCSKELCDLDCGQHGRCEGDACACDPEWGGEYCNTKLCDARCNEHGQCKNGTCLCVTGWNGKHCTIEGCPNSCAGHGQCRVSGEGQWECRCYEGWDGPDCGIALELNCGDSKDNDKDGLVDCEDPECCASHVCKTSQLCVSAPKPIDVLLRKQPPAITASFFERMKFLIDESSLQNYAKLETFNESRSAVIRGRVVTSLGMGLVGVRVSTTTLLEGFTLTRDDGWFDLMVNGGGAVTLQFGRSPFRPQSRIVQVPWNEVVIIDVVVMSMSEEKGLATTSTHTCSSHDYDLMKPVVLASWKHGFQGACPDRSAILAESQVIQESLQIPGTGLNLVYHSSRAAGYLSTIKLQLTPETIPTTLHLIHLRITIEGILFERVFEADPGIKFTYAWNRLNIYRQRVYGVTTAVVKVGYQYTDCKDIIWDIQTTKLSGHDMSISEVGGWNLDIHHRYNFHEGILQKGDGSNIYLKNKPRVILTTMGDGHQRPLECNDCEGLAMKQRLLAPVALAASPDGSLYVGDFNYIRRIMTDGTIRTVVKLNATRVSYRYHMALSPLDGTLYISDPESHQIIRVRDTNDYSQPEKNWEPIVGSGERCLPGDEAHCGDGALAKDAKLAYPKGIAISSDNIVYFADGTNIRMVDRDGIVSTLIGNHMHKSHWKPIPCEGTLKLEEMHLRWPTELAVSPLDNTLHIIDDHMILRMTPDGRVRVISGRPLHCATASTVYDTDLATHATLVMPQSIAFGPLGELYVAESDSQRINRVRVIGTDGRISAFAGAESKCNCLERGCDCFEAEHYLATSAKFNTIAALSVTPDGHVHIADQANYRIRSVMSSIPEASTSREYEIYAPDMQEIYIFNRFGQHVSTKNILTGETTYVFTYNVNTSNGKLSTVTDAAGNKVFLLRDYTSQVNSIENTKGQKCRLRMTRTKMLHELSTPDNYNVTFEYHGPTGLLKTKLDSTGRSYVYNYDEFGRLTSAVTPTGRVIDLTFDLSVKGAQVKVSENAQKEITMLIQGSTVVVRNGQAESKTTVELDGSSTSITPWGHNLQMEVVPYAILAEISPLIGESYPVPAKQRTEIAGDLANRFEWRYFVRRLQQQGKQGKAPRPVSQVGRKLRVNGDNVLTLEYDRETQSVVVMVDDKQELLNVTYDRTSRPVSFRPQSGDYADVDLEYDRFGRLVSWKWGVLQEAYSFDRNGRLNEIKYGDGSSMVYAFKDMYGSLPLKVTTPRRSDYLLQYDDAGALQSLTTPRGHIHSFSLQTSLGFFKYQYYSPINRHPFEILYNDEGQILAKIHPHQSGKVAFVHDAAGRLETILAGLSSTHYTYQDTTSLVKSIEVQEPGFELRREFKYHAGILKDEKLRFGSKNSLASAHYKYAYDGNARLSGIEMAIDDKELPTTRYKYSQNLGQLEVVQDLKITRNAFNRTVIQDSGKQFFTIVDYDQHGRVKSVLMNIKSFDVFRLELDYDLRNRIKSQKTTFGRSTAFDKINYNADGHVIEVFGTNNWKYLYDENGNTVGIIDQGEKFNLGYDIGDRVIQVGDVEFNNYDARGFVVRRGEQKYRYNNRGQLIHAFERERFQSWYYYDDRSRLVAWHDSKGNVTQYYYANPKTPKLVTHVHFPKLGKTMKFYYDDRDMLIALENADQRYYVATDQNGSPLAFFDLNGGIMKEVKRTPFGRIIKDTNPEFFVPIDFHGGLIDPHTKLVYTEGRQYDPTVGQWMTPLWEKLATEMSNPTDVFIYRYHNNDPVNPNKPQNYMIDLESWLQLFGYDLNSMQSSRYTKLAQYTPQASIKSNTLAPDFGVISGLECIVEKTNEKFSDFDFVPKPLLKMEPKMRNLLPRISYRRGVFGEGVLLSRIGGRAMVSVVDGSNSVVQDVVSSVFNNSYFLDLHFSIHDQDVFYFVKDNVLKLRDDNEELRRLGGMFNISTHEITDHGGSAAKELRLHGPDAVVIIKYGVDPEQERHRILKHAHKRAVERAWELEKQLVAAGFQGRGDWTEEEKEELVQHGDVDGWIGIDIHSIHKYPQLADDPGNVAFQRDAKRKRRKISSNHRSVRARKQQKLIDMSA